MWMIDPLAFCTLVVWCSRWVPYFTVHDTTVLSTCLSLDCTVVLYCTVRKVSNNFERTIDKRTIDRQAVIETIENWNTHSASANSSRQPFRTLQCTYGSTFYMRTSSKSAALSYGIFTRHADALLRRPHKKTVWAVCSHTHAARK